MDIVDYIDAVLDGEDIEYESDACTVCGGELVGLGQLGRVHWSRCRDCGMDNRREQA